MTPMQRRMPSTLYAMVDTPLRAEGRRIRGPPAAGPILVCSSLDVCVPGFTSYAYANVMPHTVRVCSPACLRATVQKALYYRKLEKTSGPASALMDGVPCPCSHGWRRLLTTRPAPLLAPEACLEAIGPGRTGAASSACSRLVALRRHCAESCLVG